MINLIVYCEGDYACQKKFEDMKSMDTWKDGFSEGALQYGAGGIEFFIRLSSGIWEDEEGNSLEDEDTLTELNKRVKGK